MNEQFRIAYQTKASDGAGSFTLTETTQDTPGYLWSIKGTEAGADQVKALGSHRIALPKTTSVPATAKITQLATGKVFVVKFPYPIGSYATSIIVGVEDAP